jgi:hypothetical protein
MVGEASNPSLANERLAVDLTVLQIKGRADGMQHDETRNSVFRWAKKTLRDPVPDATLHPSVLARFNVDDVQQYDVMAPYRPEPLRTHKMLETYYKNIPMPRTTCWQRVSLRCKCFKKIVSDAVGRWLSKITRSLYPENWQSDDIMSARQLTPDSIVSCIGLAFLFLFVGWGGWILLFWQVEPWLREGVWHSYPIATYVSLETSWSGLRLIVDWVLALPLTLLLVVVGVVVFRICGLFSAKLYQWASRAPAATLRHRKRKRESRVPDLLAPISSIIGSY